MYMINTQNNVNYKQYNAYVVKCYSSHVLFFHNTFLYDTVGLHEQKYGITHQN